MLTRGFILIWSTQIRYGKTCSLFFNMKYYKTSSMAVLHVIPRKYNEWWVLSSYIFCDKICTFCEFYRPWSKFFCSAWCNYRLWCDSRVILCNPKSVFVWVIAWFVVIFGINTSSDISKLLCVISPAVRRVKFETILKYHKWCLCQISQRTNHATICLYYCPQKVCNFHI